MGSCAIKQQMHIYKYIILQQHASVFPVTIIRMGFACIFFVTSRVLPKAALLWNPQGNRKRGRPRNRWRRSVIKEAGRSWNELRFLAAD